MPIFGVKECPFSEKKPPFCYAKSAIFSNYLNLTFRILGIARVKMMLHFQVVSLSLFDMPSTEVGTAWIDSMVESKLERECKIRISI